MNARSGRLAALVLGAVLLAAGPASAVIPTAQSPDLYEQAGVGLGEFTARCDFTGKRATIDPIVAPGSTTFMHSHDFFGNPGVDANSTPDSLRAQPETTCDPVADASSYWVPTLLDDGTALDAESLTAYYFVKRPQDPAQLQDMPGGMRLIAGNARASSPQSLNRIAWTCIGSSAMASTIPDCGSGTLQLAVFFPQCWDGQNTDSSDHVSHVAYANGAGACPQTHPVLIPQLELQFRWKVRPGAELSLSSDAMKGLTGGVTAHADFMNGWDLTQLSQRTNDCLRWPVVCLPNGEDRRGAQATLPPQESNAGGSAFERIEAENYSAQQGVRTEATADSGGGQNVGWLAGGDWASYAGIDFGDGAALLRIRVASAVSTTSRLELRLDDRDGPLLASAKIPQTGGWQSWRTLELALDGNSVTGLHDMYLVVVGPAGQDIGNINWLTFEPKPAAQTGKIEAEDYDSHSGVGTEPTSDTGAGENIGWLAHGDWARYERVDFASGADLLQIRVASPVTTGGRLEFRVGSLDGPVIARVEMPNTGGWQNWRTLDVPLVAKTGVHDVYLVVVNSTPGQDIGNVNWLTFQQVRTAPDPGQRSFWQDQRGIGFSVSSLGALPGDQRLVDALRRVQDLEYTSIRTWGADGYTRKILRTIAAEDLPITVQVGVWITSDSTARPQLDQALETVSGLEEHVLGISLGNEQLADWNSSDMTPGQLSAQIDYMRDRTDLPLTYNLSDSTLRPDSSFWSNGGAEVLAKLDYVNVHDYGATFGGDNRWNPAYTPDRQLRIIEADAQWLADLFDSLGLAQTPIVLGETGWQSAGYSPEVTNAANASAYARLIADYVYSQPTRFDSMFYFNLSDETWKAGDDHWGLFREGDADGLGDRKFDLAPLRQANQR